MDFGKQGSWDSWSDEYEHQKDEELDNDSTKRPYECTFCKRGFTNAQALGGHMNIHRKDRAKAKRRTSSSHSNHQIFPHLSSQPTAPLPPSYRMYFDTTAAAMAANSPIHQQRSESVNEELLLGANLSLQIDQNRGVWKNEELDLELRLGHEYR
ncbi:transcriptional regulator SUPERMAN-like [Cucurbita moschata]|uniref:Transcriptional regulator SUPERMAN-like n=1 Tax=Cucurbita moschata TaxID=3662 RepID=A0A6J1GCF2_CUCMO|nr:transcriptional regulator SUPERMAN-like [Cucurbita moschata]